jgi:predicted dehydrogenase
MSSDFRWGILGTGGIARAFASDLALIEGHALTAVGSRSAEGAHEFASLFPGCQAHASYEELVASDVDAIYVATPHTYHSRHSLLALNAGKPVLCEKPFTIDAAEAATVIARSHELKLPLMEAMWTRFLPHIATLRTIIQSGTLGTIHTLTADHGQYLPIEKHPRLWLPELGGGALLDLGIYPLTLADIVLGEPSSITAVATLTELGVDLQTSMTLTYPSGAHALLTCTMANRTQVGAVISGDLARVEIDDFFFAPTAMRVITRDGDITEYPKRYDGNGLREEAREFARIVREGVLESPLAPHSMTMRLMDTMDEVRRQIGVNYPQV